MVKIDFLGEKPNVKAEKTNFVVGNHVEISINNVEIYLDVADFEYLMALGAKILDKQGG